MRYFKRCRSNADAKAQALWLNVTDNNLGAVALGNVLEYEWIDGHIAFEWKRAWVAAHRFWQPKHGSHQIISRCAYVKYMTRHHDCTDQLWKNVFCIIRNAHLSPVTHCHGDMTLENIIVDRVGDICFIDPGYSRGLPCRQIDEAKLLQSLDGWHECNTGSRVSMLPPFPMKHIHLALLCTHYCRLLKHKHPSHCLEFARIRLEHWLRFLGEKV